MRPRSPPPLAAAPRDRNYRSYAGLHTQRMGGRLAKMHACAWRTARVLCKPWRVCGFFACVCSFWPGPSCAPLPRPTRSPATQEAQASAMHTCMQCIKCTRPRPPIITHPLRLSRAWRQGFAYVEFLEVDAVQNAMLLDNSELRARQIKVCAHTSHAAGAGAPVPACHCMVVYSSMRMYTLPPAAAAAGALIPAGAGPCLCACGHVYCHRRPAAPQPRNPPCRCTRSGQTCRG